jgi:hypothetical protein
MVGQMKPFTVDDAYNYIRNHKLYPLQEGGDVVAYWLRKHPDAYLESTLIVGTPVGVAIMGDTTPGRGIVIRGLSIDGFSLSHEPRYLAKKCLPSNVYQESLAKREVLECYNELVKRSFEERSKSCIKQARQIQNDIIPGLDQYGWDQGSVISAMQDIIGEGAIELGLDFDEIDLAWLGAIQRRFHETYAALKMEVT